jgi:hypothetical protein
VSRHRRWARLSGDKAMEKIKYVFMVLCTISVCTKVAVHTYRHFHQPAAMTTAAQ